MKLSRNEVIRQAVINRMNDLNIRPADIIKEAKSKGIKITAPSFSNYKSGKETSLTDEQLLWICCRLYIPITLNIGVATLKNKSLVWEIPTYSEEGSNKLLSQMFGNG